jgi:hypothetical protein
MMLDRAPVVWGLLDLSFFGWFVGKSLLAGRVPIYSDLRRAGEIATSFGDPFPIEVAAVGTIIFISLPVSGTLLCLRKHFGVVLAYAQFPFRLAFAVPSLFFIPWLMAPLPLQIAIPVYIVLIVSSELFKVWSLWFWERRVVVASYGEPDNT